MLTLLRQLIREGREAAGSLVFADACALCHQPRPSSAVPGLCGQCAESLPRVSRPYCEVCGEWFVGQITGSFRCSNCADRRFAFDFAYAPLQARGGARELVHRFKYRRELWLCPTLAALMASALGGETAEPRLAAEPHWLLVPVPLHPRRLREREFNQALELSRALARLTGLAVADVLRRTRYTTGQASLDRAKRLANLRLAFALRRPVPWRASVRNHPVLLIDDVFTTGATTHECARVLKNDAGASRIVVLTAARG